jgi:hypothetical protein
MGRVSNQDVKRGDPHNDDFRPRQGRLWHLRGWCGEILGGGTRARG